MANGKPLGGKHTGALSPDCEEFLSSQECYSVRGEFVGVVGVYDNDGFRMFTVTPTIAVFDLRTIFGYGDNRHKRGLREGRDAFAAHLRGLLNAAPLEPTR
jgi:hypothetical protein